MTPNASDRLISYFLIYYKRGNYMMSEIVTVENRDGIFWPLLISRSAYLGGQLYRSSTHETLRLGDTADIKM